MKRIQLILFLFAILLEISQSMSPKKNIYELPIIPINQTKSRKSKIIPQKNYTFANSKYFAFNLRDIRTINNFMFFQINSTRRSKSFSYAKYAKKLPSYCSTIFFTFEIVFSCLTFVSSFASVTLIFNVLSFFNFA